jgi:3-mercaptopyruvate sulfurtransferase SseA
VQDIASIKQNQDNKAIINQTNFKDSFNKEVNEQFTKVSDADEAKNENKRFDARDKGDNEYTGEGGKERNSKNPRNNERVIVKSSKGNFDIKI